MRIIKVRIYEGRDLNYSKEGIIQNRNQTIKMTDFEFRNKFLEHGKTLAQLITLEEVYEAEPVKNGNSKCTPCSKAVHQEYDKMLKKMGVQEVVIDPMAQENQDLKAQNDKNEEEIIALNSRMDDMKRMIEEAAKTKVPEKVESSIPTPEEKTAKEDFKPEEVSPPNKFDKMSRPELLKEAEKVGIVLKGSENMKTIIEMLTA